MNARQRFAAVVLAGMLTLAACGGDDTTPPSATDPSTQSTTTPAEATDDSAGSTGSTTPPTGDDPVPTIAPDLPEPFLAGVGPVTVVGDALPPYPTEGDDPAVGMLAPVLIGETIDGEPIRVDAAVDGPTWVIFLAHWCPHCNDEIPVINQLRDEGRIPEGINVVGVSTAFNPDRPNWPPDEWLAERDWTFTAINDGIDTEASTYIAANEFGIGGFPFSMLVDGDGIVTTRWSGERDADELETLLANNLSLS